jgi:glycine/D-amino acid oxidase-like deaminating enzyme
VVDLSPSNRKAIVIGGGFYGARLATSQARAGNSVLLLEREPSLLTRASLNNQARVHQGYHYPRSILTAVRSRQNYERFRAEYPEAMDESFDHYYAIARDSKTTAAQFLQFCARIGAPASPAPDHIRGLFDKARIEDVLLVRECAFNAVKLRERLSHDLNDAGVEVLTGAEVLRVSRTAGRGLEVRWKRHGNLGSAVADSVFNCTYSGLNLLLHASGATVAHLKRELAEMALVRTPPELDGIGVTVVDGPYFSLMPYPARPGLSTLSHVRYTPHCAWLDAPGAVPVDGTELLHGHQTRFPHMIRDAARYLPALESCEHADSLWEIKAVMPRSEQDDSRPILFRESPDIPGLFSVLGAKIDSIYDVEAELSAVHAGASGTASRSQPMGN